MHILEGATATTLTMHFPRKTTQLKMCKVPTKSSAPLIGNAGGQVAKVDGGVLAVLPLEAGDQIVLQETVCESNDAMLACTKNSGSMVQQSRC